MKIFLDYYCNGMIVAVIRLWSVSSQRRSKGECVCMDGAGVCEWCENCIERFFAVVLKIKMMLPEQPLPKTFANGNSFSDRNSIRSLCSFPFSRANIADMKRPMCESFAMKR